jgi:hypothetical protein
MGNPAHYYYSEGLDFKNLGLGNTFLSVRHISNMITTRMVPHNFYYFLGAQESMRKNDYQ